MKLKIEESIIEKPRKVKVLYLNPEFPEFFMNDDVHWKMISRDSFLRNRHGMHVFENK